MDGFRIGLTGWTIVLLLCIDIIMVLCVQDGPMYRVACIAVDVGPLVQVADTLSRRYSTFWRFGSATIQPRQAAAGNRLYI